MFIVPSVLQCHILINCLKDVIERGVATLGSPIMKHYKLIYVVSSTSCTSNPLSHTPRASFLRLEEDVRVKVRVNFGVFKLVRAVASCADDNDLAEAKGQRVPGGALNLTPPCCNAVHPFLHRSWGDEPILNETQSVDELKDEIKKKKHRLALFDADALTLYKSKSIYPTTINTTT